MRSTASIPSLSARRLSHDPSLTKWTMLSQQRDKVPDQRKTVIVDIKRHPKSAAKSVQSFFATVDSVQGKMDKSEQPFMYQIMAVGIRVSGRSSQYDLMYFPHTDLVAAVDIRDESYVGTTSAAAAASSVCLVFSVDKHEENNTYQERWVGVARSLVGVKPNLPIDLTLCHPEWTSAKVVKARDIAQVEEIINRLCQVHEEAKEESNDFVSLRNHKSARISRADFRALKEFEQRHPELFINAPVAPVAHDPLGDMVTQGNAFNAVFTSRWGDELRQSIGM